MWNAADTTVYDCSIVSVPTVGQRAGNISIIDNAKSTLPFETKRVFYLYDIPGGESRGAHAHKECHQFLIAASGAFEVLLDDASVVRQIHLNRPYIGLHIPPGIWAQEINFSSGGICLVFASHKFDADDYIRIYVAFEKLKEAQR